MPGLTIARRRSELQVESSGLPSVTVRSNFGESIDRDGLPMGLNVTVGLLSDLLENDEEGAGWVSEHFAEINQVLSAAGFGQHAEPRSCEVWSADGYGYSGLHALREVAGLAWRNRPVPRRPRLTGRDDTPNEDELFYAVLPFVSGEGITGLFRRIFGRRSRKEIPPFGHLVCHSDAEGYYLPIDFPVPLAPAAMRDETASIWPVGSVPRLNAELDALVKLLEIPDDLHSGSEALWEALDSDEPDLQRPLWRAQPIAAYSAVVLRDACRMSIKSGAAIAFC